MLAALSDFSVLGSEVLRVVGHRRIWEMCFDGQQVMEQCLVTRQDMRYAMYRPSISREILDN